MNNDLVKITPERSAELRAAALAVRRRNSQICKDLAENPTTYADVINNPEAKKIKVKRLVKSVISGIPGVGEAIVNQILTDVTHRGIKTTKGIGALGSAQKATLIKILDQYIRFI